MARHNRRSTRPLEDLPNLFGGEETELLHELTLQTIEDSKKRAVTKTPAEEMSVPDEYRGPRRELRFMSLGSGSSGNCAYVGTPDAGILIDAGVDNKKVDTELARNSIDINTIKGIFLTHDHADHVKFAYSILRRHPHMRLYSTLKVLEGLLRRHNISRRIKEYHTPIFKEHEYVFDGIVVIPFETSHDGTDNCGFAITLGDTHLVIATDMGIVTERADHYMRQASTIVIESNYDADMLENGRYTEYLKARIRSPRGHMNNSVTAKYLTDIYTPSLRHIFLCHLSEDNNTPETAVATTINALRTRDIRPATSILDIPDKRVFITALPRHETTPLYVL